ncbi:methionine/alanine import family NSS transporter small subunit [Gordonia sp. (in: high G+C Gram-positive bacteria)]|uniref:methionine/alanine import family NSS transporter small subunit n=1 Tax=Gordonia sp. (in: high G+C Gram-positive bacteria) TaxID=84139 RepID=UPI003C743B48
MTGGAILFLIIAAVVVWGGLAASIAFLVRHPEVEELPDEPAALVRDDVVRESEPHPTRDT